MSEKRLISVIVPVYKVEQYISRCIDSILAQTYTNLEIILVDDGSPDNSGKICDEYLEKDNRIVVFHKPNGGVSSARNLGIDNAHGEYITFVDGDDYIAPEMYSVLTQNISVHNADISICGFFNENNKSEFIRYCSDSVVRSLSQQEQLECLLCNRYYSCSCWDKLIKKELVTDIRFSTDVTHYEDLLFMWKVMKKSKKAVFTSEPYYYYCTNEGSASTVKFGKKQMSMLDVCDYILDDAKSISKDLYKTAREQYVRNYLMCASLVVKGGYNKEEDLQRIRNVVKENLSFALASRLAIGYKMLALKLSLGWCMFSMGIE